MLAELDDPGARARAEVALLVEDAVVGQVDLVVDAGDAAVREHGCGVVDVGGAVGEADDGDDPVRLLGEAVDRVARVAQEVFLVEEVLRRVSGDGELAEHGEAGPGPAGLGERGRDRPLVAGDVADRRVELAQREPERPHTRNYRASSSSSPWTTPRARSAGSGTARASLVTPKQSDPA